MKEVKFLLLCLAVSAYTSLGWIVFLTDWLAPGHSPFVGGLLFGIATLAILLMAGFYIHDHWGDKPLFSEDDDE